MESSFATILPNLSIGVISILGLVYVTKIFIERLKDLNVEHTTQLVEREKAMRDLEREVRTSIMHGLNQNTEVMREVMRAHNIAK